ncbi:MAG TPA: hypothetical protein VF546_08715 [Pyrinomonadaceae bacterium]|jgi:hypothetical protein
MPDREPMMCPVCGVAMNHHADKIDQGAVADSADADDPELAAVLEAHTCPKCGETQTRPAA